MKTDYFDTVKSFFEDVLVPRHMQLVQHELTGEGRSDIIVEYDEEEISEMMEVLNQIIKKCSDVPEEVFVNLTVFCIICLIAMCSSRKYPYIPHGRDCF